MMNIAKEDLSGKQVKLRLVGAKTYTSRPLGIGIAAPVVAGDVIEVPIEYTEHLLKAEWREGKHGRYPVWTKDLDAPVHLKSVDPAPIEAQRAIDEDKRKMEEALNAANARAEAAEQRALDIMARIDALEAKQSEPAPKAAPRKRASKKAAE